jgi:cell division protein FtsB
MRAIPIIINQTIAGAFVALIWLVIPFAAMGQDAAPSPPSSDYVSRAEYDKLKAEHEAMKTELDALKTAVRQMAGTAPAAPAEGPAAATKPSEGKQVVTTTAAQTDVAALQAEVDTLKTQVKETFPGTTKFLLAGYGTAGFTARSGEDPFFDASFNALFLYKLTDRLFFEGEMELEFENGATTINLEVAQASYLLNDYMTIGVGRFLNPMDFFVERQHMNWVNKLPDKPLAVYDGLLPESQLGAQLRGVVPLGPTKLEYVGFVANAPGLITAPDDFSELGMLDFPNTSNVGGHVAVGGHVGFIPIPELEVGYGIQRSKVGPRDHAVENVLQSADFNYVRDSTLLKGLINFRAQWVWSHVGHFVYDPDGEQGFGPLSFNNNRNGGYVQMAYRPTKIDNDIIKNLEGVVRYDRLNQLHTPVGFDEERVTLGLNYWLTPSAVVKAAYEFDNKNGGARDQDAFMMQMAVGF